jgi:hypothetical protein
VAMPGERETLSRYFKTLNLKSRRLQLRFADFAHDPVSDMPCEL